MSPEALRAFFRMGMWVAVVAFIMVLLIPRDQPEFVISVCSLGIGVALMGGVLLVNRFLR